MPSDPARWTDADFRQRAQPETLPELMDGDCTYDEFRSCLRSLDQINALSLGYRPVFDFLKRLSRARKLDHPLHVAEIGSGSGRLLRRIARWARRVDVDVRLTGIDINPFATRAAREMTPDIAEIHFLHADVFSWHPKTPVDVILSCLFTHHLSSPDVVRFLRWSEDHASLGWFVNDLYRSSQPLGAFGLAARVFRWHRFTRHDGPVSFRRAFREEDWQRYLAEATLPTGAARIRKWFPARLCVERIK